MPVIEHSQHQAPWYLPNAHLQTIYPSLFRKVKGVTYERRQRITTPDDDFLDLDWSPIKTNNHQLAILSHGLEGSSEGGYIMGMAKTMQTIGWDVLAWNFRGCSGEDNRLLRAYHSGATEDLEVVVEEVLQNYPQYTDIVLIGFSMGGNISVKYAGEQGKAISPRIKKIVVFSVPLNLESCAYMLQKGFSKIYDRRFLNTLTVKMRSKVHLMPPDMQARTKERIKNIIQFDDYFTAPIHGFKDAMDYYHKCSGEHFVPHITVPTLIVNAKNDPFLGEACYPYELFKKLPNVYFETPQQGGHVGFKDGKIKDCYWSEQRAVEFIEQE